MRSFVLQRNEDETGISGVGTVAEGVQFLDGTVVLRWLVGEHRSTVVWASIESVEAIHGHNGSTEIVWYEQRKVHYLENGGMVHGITNLGGADLDVTEMPSRVTCETCRAIMKES